MISGGGGGGALGAAAAENPLLALGVIVVMGLFLWWLMNR